MFSLSIRANRDGPGAHILNTHCLEERFSICSDIFRPSLQPTIYEACTESKATSRVGRYGYFICLLWQHFRRPWSFTCEPYSFDSGRTGFVWVRRVWNGSADPKSRQMRGAFPHTIFQCKAEIHKKMVAVYGNGMNRQYVTKKEPYRWEKVRRRWWGARRSHDVVQSAGGRLVWLGDTETGSRT